MKRVIPFLLALLLLSTCGQAVPEPTAEVPTEIESTTESITTTEETEASFVSANGESSGVTWRMLDVGSGEGKELQKWLEEQWEKSTQPKEAPTEFPMGKDKTIITRFDRVILRENKTRKDTVLLEKQYLGEEATPEEALLREEAWRYPRLIQALDERYFIYDWAYWEGGGYPGVYDTQTMRTIPIEYGDKLRHGDWYTSKELIFADVLYLLEGTYSPWEGPLRLMRANLKALDALNDGDALMAADVLKDIPGVEDAFIANYRFVTEDERYFIMNDFNGLRVYDLKKKQVALQLSASVFGPGAEEAFQGRDHLTLDGDKLYWTDRPYRTDLAGYSKYLAEITLP